MWLLALAQIWSCFHIALHLCLLFTQLFAQQGMSILSASHWTVSGTLLTSSKEPTITPSWLMGQSLPSLISSQRKNSVSLSWNPGSKLQCSWGEVGAAGVHYNQAETLLLSMAVPNSSWNHTNIAELLSYLSVCKEEEIAEGLNLSVQMFGISFQSLISFQFQAILTLHRHQGSLKNSDWIRVLLIVERWTSDFTAVCYLDCPH